VVFLRGVDVRAARPWDHPPVRVEQKVCRFRVRQGDVESQCGFLRRSDDLTMISLDEAFHSLHAGGAAFFTLTFPDPFQPRRRRLDQNGLVELSSSAGYFWVRAYLFVDEHPYYTRTNEEGRFTLPQVPPGQYDLVCWLPRWVLERQERDPESGHITRVYFRPPLEDVRPVILGTRETVEVSLRVGMMPTD
jgi:hypothetical protein